MKKQLSDLIAPTTPSGTALFLQWNGYHVFSIPKRELVRSSQSVRFFGVGGKRMNSSETFIDCALRESAEEIGHVVTNLLSAEQTYFFKADGTIECVDLSDDAIQPRLILEKRIHSAHGSMPNSNDPYYLVAFDANLSAKPQPSSEIAAIVYLKDRHLAWMKGQHRAIAELTQAGAHIEYQANLSLQDSTVLIPHGTASFLVKQQP